MEYNPEEEELIRKYLLGELSESDLEAVERRIMTDGEFSRFGLVVESMLVEDYVEHRLQGQDRENFEKLFLATPQGTEQVRFTQVLKEHASKIKPSESSGESPRRSWLSMISLPRWLLAAATIL